MTELSGCADYHYNKAFIKKLRINMLAGQFVMIYNELAVFTGDYFVAGTNKIYSRFSAGEERTVNWIIPYLDHVLVLKTFDNTKPLNNRTVIDTYKENYIEYITIKDALHNYPIALVYQDNIIKFHNHNILTPITLSDILKKHEKIQ